MEAGILGRPFLSAFNCVVDNQSGLIRLRRNSAQASAFPLDSFAIPFTLDGDKMIVSAGINGREVDMCFDTGSFGVCLSKSQCEQLRIKVPDTLAERTHGPNGVAVSSWQVSGEISLGPIHKRAFPIRVIDSEISYPLLGQNFFGDRNYKIDTTKKEIRFAR
jgi:predicted aspartyl protease